LIGDVYEFPVTLDDFQWISSITTMGAAFSCLPAGFLVDLIGRKNTMLAMSLPFVVGKMTENFTIAAMG
jgi:MFS family permease